MAADQSPQEVADDAARAPARAPDPVLQMLERDAASAAFGIELVEHRAGYARTRMVVRPDMINGHGLAHGAVVFAVADTAFACACNSWGPVSVAAAAEIVFLSGCRAGDVLEAEAVVRTRRGRVGIYDVTVRRGEEVVAEFRGRSSQLSDRDIEPR